MKRKNIVAFTVTALMSASPFAFGAGNYEQQQQPEEQRMEQSQVEGEQQQQQEQQFDQQEILKIQQALNEKGFHSENVDGILGPETRRSIENFQEDQDLTASGELDQETIDALGVDVDLKQAQEEEPQKQEAEKQEQQEAQKQEAQKQEAEKQEQQEPQKQEAEKQERQDVTATDPAEEQQQQEESSLDQLSQDQIVEIQQTLNDEGFHSGNVDGMVGPDTKEALKKFQEEKGLSASGDIDQETIDELGVDVDLKQAQEESESGMFSE
ncbi:MAG: peptidoglycan-binding domain-containing protein [Bacteriovoracaceae bacterium]